jgi:NAD(P)-dependent dehydrogenase (short-subunit alcohol dehydrogenase family)
MKPVDQLVILVTGSTDGIGMITAHVLAGMGATVLVHGRSSERCRRTVTAIREHSGNERVSSYIGDFSSLREVRAMAQQIVSDLPRLDVLINNAGVGPGNLSDRNRPLSQDGHELLFAVNYLAPFLLTHLILPVLGQSDSARIVNVTSAAQEEIDFGDVMLEKEYDPWRAYAQSKLALTLFTFDMAEGLKDTGVTVNCLHPGSLLDTKMVRESSVTPLGKADSGAEVEVYVATSPELEARTGLYFDRKKETRAHEQAYDPEARARLRRIGEELTGIS